MNKYLYGKVTVIDRVNSNNRLYPMDELVKAVTEYNTRTEKLSEVIPLERTHILNLDNVGAVCEELTIDGNALYAKLRIVDSKSGTNLKEVLNKQGKAMLSLRGTTSPLWLDNEVLQVKDLDIISIDVLPFDGVDISTICTVTNV